MKIAAAVLCIVLFAVSCMFAGDDFPPDSIAWKTLYTRHDYRIPMRDGVKLYTVVYTPKDSSEPHPIIMSRTPYSVGPYSETSYPNGMLKLSREYAKRHYIFVFQDVRGKFMSEGDYVEMRPYVADKTKTTAVDESSDSYDTVDWLIHNIPGNNGKVGIKGISYPGFYTTMASIDAHPAVKATSPQAPVSEWMGGDDWFHNGAFLMPHAFDFYSQLGWQRKGPSTNEFRPFDHGTPDGYTFYLRLGAIPNANRLYLHDSIAFWNELTNHGTWDDFWAARSVLPHLTNIKPATLVVGGWFDTENLWGALHTFGRIEHDNPGHPNTLVMGPWAHHWWTRDDLDSLGPIRFGSNLTKYFADSLEVPFFDYYLRGTGTNSLPKAVVFMTGANQWTKYDQWPPRNAEQAKLYLAGSGKLEWAPPAGGGAGYDEYVSDPMKPVPYTAEITNWYDAPFMLEDQRFASRRPDVLVYQSDILTEPVTVAGPITVNLTGSTSGTDCDWIVKVIDVFPDTLSTPQQYPTWFQYGGYQMLVRGDVLRGKFRNSRSTPEPVASDVPTQFPFVLQDVLHRFNPGHRIMIQVQSTWFPMIDRNPGTFEDIFNAKDSDFHPTVQRVYHAPGKLSSIGLGVIK
jgi:uncharacterized protein